MPEHPGPNGGAESREHFYGGQAVIEGVMMRGRDHWALAVRTPDQAVHVESHDIDSIARRHPVLGRPGLRGVLILGQSLAIGFRALTRAAELASPEEERLSSGQMGLTMAAAGLIFVGVFIVAPAVLFGWIGHRLEGAGLWVNVAEGIFRVGIFLGYLVLISRAKDIRRVFQYHGAEHETIAAYEHGDELTPENVRRYSTLHVRCGTNFLLIVMVITIFIFSLFGSPSIPVRILSRVVAIPLIAAFAYEMLRLGARFPRSLVMKIVMAPGLWLQRITTKTPDDGQIEVAICAFGEVLRVESEGPDPDGRLSSRPVSPTAEGAVDPSGGENREPG
jgi:uncharacterized protein YqhQ